METIEIMSKYENGNIKFTLEKNIEWIMKSAKISFIVNNDIYICPLIRCCDDYIFGPMVKCVKFKNDFEFNIKLNIKEQIKDVKIWIDKSN